VERLQKEKEMEEMLRAKEEQQQKIQEQLREEQ